MTTRTYRMTDRADAAAATAERILDAAIETYWEGSFDLPLREVARRADVTEQTVLRRFGSKERLLSAAVERESERIREQRDSAPEDDAPAAIAVLIDHYEKYGEAVIRMLAHEDRYERLQEIAAGGRKYHEAWCERVFADSLHDCHGSDRRRRLAQLIAVTDVYVWKLLRIDRGLSRRDTETAIVGLVEALRDTR